MLSMEAVSEHDDGNSLMPPRIGSRRMSTISGGRRASVLSNEIPGKCNSFIYTFFQIHMFSNQ